MSQNAEADRKVLAEALIGIISCHSWSGPEHNFEKLLAICSEQANQALRSVHAEDFTQIGDQSRREPTYERMD